jgi:hypothetical protein
MTPDERQLISDLFQRMREYGAPEKDREAEALINQSVRANPDAPYMLVQSVLVQEQALQQAGQRIEELEERLREAEGAGSRGRGAGSFLGGVWGGGRSEPAQRTSVPAIGSRAGGAAPAWAQSAPQQPQPAQAGGGGGFMKSALATAAGVAGGMLLANSIGNLLGGGSAHAGQRSADEETTYIDEADNDPGNYDPGNDPGFDSGGGDLEV